jgi:hypothetical protein
MKSVTINRHRLIVRSILIAMYIGLLVVMLFTGKRHTILIDNKEAADGSYQAIDGMTVQIDKQEASEYYPGDRDKAMVNGQQHSIRVEILADGKVIENKFSVPLGQDMVLISVPKLVAGITPFMEPFTIQEEQASVPEPAAPQQFGGDSNAPAEAAPAAPVLIQ